MQIDNGTEEKELEQIEPQAANTNDSEDENLERLARLARHAEASRRRTLISLAVSFLTIAVLALLVLTWDKWRPKTPLEQDLLNVQTQVSTIEHDVKEIEKQNNSIEDNGEIFKSKINNLEDSLKVLTNENPFIPRPAPYTIPYPAPSPGKINLANIVENLRTTQEQVKETVEQQKFVADDVKNLNEIIRGRDDSEWPGLIGDNREIRARLNDYDDKFYSNEISLNSLRSEIRELRTIINSLRKTTQDTTLCSKGDETNKLPYLTYVVREGLIKKQIIYDLNIKIHLEGVKNGVLQKLIIYSEKEEIIYPKPTPSNASTRTLSVQSGNIKMGERIFFTDEFHVYSLIPIYLNQRFLSKDFIGLAISKGIKCS